MQRPTPTKLPNCQPSELPDNVGNSIVPSNGSLLLNDSFIRDNNLFIQVFHNNNPLAPMVVILDNDKGYYIYYNNENNKYLFIPVADVIQ